MALKLSTLAHCCLAIAIIGIQGVAATASLARETEGAVGADGVDGVDGGSWRPIVVAARGLGCLAGSEAERVGLFSCSSACVAIPWQLDERDGAGEYALDSGPLARVDADGGAVDANDEIVFMWSDAGEVATGEIPGEPLCVDEIAIRVGDMRRTVYAARYDRPAPASPVRYVDYDVAADRMRGRQVDLTFGAATPRDLALRTGPAAGRDLLDRLKIRAYARFFGIFPLHRDEDDIQSVYEAWKIGPIRVIRRERKWVRLAFGYRTPYILSETMLYRDFVQLPVSLRLNFPPATLLFPIEIWAALDFLNLEGWQLWLPGGRSPLTVGEVSEDRVEELSSVDDVSVLALEGADATFALALRLGPTLRSLRKTVFYYEGEAPSAPEDQAGAMPGLGFRLGRWDDVASGPHWFIAESYGLPAGYDLESFAREIEVTPILEIGPRQRDGAAG